MADRIIDVRTTQHITGEMRTGTIWVNCADNAVLYSVGTTREVILASGKLEKYLVLNTSRGLPIEKLYYESCDNPNAEVKREIRPAWFPKCAKRRYLREARAFSQPA